MSQLTGVWCTIQLFFSIRQCLFFFPSIAMRLDKPSNVSNVFSDRSHRAGDMSKGLNKKKKCLLFIIGINSLSSYSIHNLSKLTQFDHLLAKFWTFTYDNSLFQVFLIFDTSLLFWRTFILHMKFFKFQIGLH